MSTKTALPESLETYQAVAAQFAEAAETGFFTATSIGTNLASVVRTLTPGPKTRSTASITWVAASFFVM
ncbi:MAG: hypothetical protein MSIBF_02240 [Candidatus Altiarchaeales archaeon IMC4]|nr:MAG: hypothetical protein MSIBF_02240 [Candidatus Altiarchaeales archaeon IMC4]